MPSPEVYTEPRLVTKTECLLGREGGTEAKSDVKVAIRFYLRGVWLHFSDPFICKEVDIGIYLILTRGWV